METKNLVHMAFNVRVEFDLDPITGETTNRVHRVSKIPEEKFENAVKEPTPEEKFDLCPAARLGKSSIKLTRAAALAMGIIDANGEFMQTVKGNRICVQIGFSLGEGTNCVVINVDNEEKLVNSQRVTDSLTIRCSGMTNNLVSQIGTFFSVHKMTDTQWRLVPEVSEQAIIDKMRHRVGEPIKITKKQDVTESPVEDENPSIDLGKKVEEKYADESLLSENDGILPDDMAVDFPEVNDPEISGTSGWQKYDDEDINYEANNEDI